MVGARTCCVNNSEIARFARQVATIFYHLFVDSIGSLLCPPKRDFVLFLEVSFSRSICLYLNHALASALFLSEWLDY